jgi:hypothetical protein
MNEDDVEFLRSIGVPVSDLLLLEDGETPPRRQASSHLSLQ